MTNDETERTGPSFALGLLAAAPLALFYEWSVVRSGGTVRNTAERVLTLPVSWLGDASDSVRQLVLLGAALAALVLARRATREDEVPLAARVFRQPLEGFAAALALGPALIWTQRLLADTAVELGHGAVAGRLAPSIESGALVGGGAFYEELVFRVGAIGLVQLVCRAALDFLGAPRHASRVVAEALGLVGAAALFAAFHLGALSHLVGVAGEPFDAAAFSWRFLGGCLLGVLFLWRGFGVAAWCHALFNLALLLGAGPGVLDR